MAEEELPIPAGSDCGSEDSALSSVPDDLSQRSSSVIHTTLPSKLKYHLLVLRYCKRIYPLIDATRNLGAQPSQRRQPATRRHLVAPQPSSQALLLQAGNIVGPPFLYHFINRESNRLK